jgi:serine/threonine protein kinase
MDRDRFSRRYTSDDTLDLARHEELLRTKLQARMLPGLYERLQSIKGFCLQQAYAVRSLFDVGGQGILYLAEDLLHEGMQVLIKMPFLPHHTPAYIDMEMIKQARNNILLEAYTLQLFPGTILPEFYDFFYGDNPLYDSAWDVQVTNREPYLVMEFIQGHSLEEDIFRRHSAQVVDYRAIERLAWDLAYEIADLCEILWEQGHFLYTDLRPQNIMLAHRNDRRGISGWRRRFDLPEKPLPPRKISTPVRLIDAGSIICCRENLSAVPYHPSYIPPDLYKKGTAGESWLPDSEFVIFTLGKTLFQLITNREPLPGLNPDFGEPILQNYSPPLRSVLQGMHTGKYSDFKELRAVTEKHHNYPPR